MARLAARVGGYLSDGTVTGLSRHATRGSTDVSSSLSVQQEYIADRTVLPQSWRTNASTSGTMSMASSVTPRTLYADRLESAIGTLLLIHDREGHLRALDFHDFEPRMRRLLRLHYGGEGNDF